MKTLVYASLAGCVLMAVSGPAPAQPADPSGQCAPEAETNSLCDPLEPDEALIFDGRGGAFYEEANDVAAEDEPASAWFAGQVLPRDAQVTIVADYRLRGLAAPQPGYYYVQAGGRTLLIQSATGTIVQTY